ncbi:EF-hand calcium-binding domain-containing protein 7-like [Diadema antillarum]|uniref:EF-hand calcium-binding domain-containing protein 7-like n=1 Tax=Diadema antillarum TaxID=105358 RepID=UPI003A855FC5
MSGKPSSGGAGGKASQAKRNGALSMTEKDKTEAECRAAYMAVFNDPATDITSRDGLERVLQQAGRNPSKQTIDKYWTKDTNKLTFNDVLAIVKELKPTSEDDLLHAFQKIDVNGDGYITQKELSKVLTQRGDKMSEKEVEDMIAEADIDGDRKLNYKEFCKLVMSTTSKCQESSLKRLERRERRQRRDKRKEPSSSSSSTSSKSAKKKEEIGVVMTFPPISKQQPSQREPTNLKDWYHSHSKGCFHFDDEQKLIAHQYIIDVAVTTKLWLTVRPITVGVINASKQEPKTDINVFIMRQGDNGLLGELVAFTNVKNKEKYCIQCELQAGHYRLIPMTTGCHLKVRTRSVKEKVKLVEPKGEDECTLTKEFKSTLNDIFEMVDLDGNGLLSRNEFNLFQLRTSGEAVDDDAWEVVEENFELKKGELTRKGFMDLNQMEATDGFTENGEVDDLWVTLSSMGFAEDLVLDEACPFLVDIYTQHCPCRIRAQPLQRGGPTLQKIICQSVMNAAGFTRVKSVGDLRLHTYMGDGRVTFIVENKGSNKCGIKLDCSKSKNCLSSDTKMCQTVQCYSGAAVVGLHLVPEDEDKEWTINCQESLGTS